MQHHQRRTYSAFVIASNTRRRGASNTRVIKISVSDGSVTSSFPLPRFSDMTVLLFLELFEQVVEFQEARFPHLAVALEPVGRLAKRRHDEPARAPLCVATPRDEPCPLQHLDVLRDGRLAHGEWLGELQHG